MIAPACRASNCRPRESAEASPQASRTSVVPGGGDPCTTYRRVTLPGQVVAATTTCPGPANHTLDRALRITHQLLEISASISSSPSRRLGFWVAPAMAPRPSDVRRGSVRRGYGEAAQARGGWFDPSPPDLGDPGVLFLVGSDSTHPTPSGSEPGPGGGHIELARRLVIHLGGSESSP